jgi:ribosome-binding ATPase YchF (GTP1/OBG family)
VDAILHVVRCFENADITHVENSVDPIRDIDTIDTELALADLETVSSSLDKAERLARSGDKEAIAKSEVLKRCKTHLNEGKPVRQLEFDAEQAKIVKGLGLITAKKVLYVANVDEADIHGEGPLVQKVKDRAKQEGGGVVPVCGKLESELAELGPDDRKEMLESMGLKEPALATLTREAYTLLGLQSYFTSGPKKSAPGPFPSARRLRRRRASSTPTSSAPSSAPRCTRWTTSSSTKPNPPLRPPGRCARRARRTS